MAQKDVFVYFSDDSTAVRLDTYRKRDDLQKRPVAYTIDTATGQRTEGKPKVERKADAPKGADA